MLISLYLDANLEPTVQTDSGGYILVDIDDNLSDETLNINTYIDAYKKVNNQLIKVTMIKFEKLILYYAKFKNINKYTKVNTVKIGSAITGNMAILFRDGKYSAYDDLAMLSNTIEKGKINKEYKNYKNIDKEKEIKKEISRRLNYRNQILERIDELVPKNQSEIIKLKSVQELCNINNFRYKYKLKNKDNRKITQFHHLHVRLVDIFRNSDYIELKGQEAVLALYLDRFTNIHSTHATFFVYFKSLPLIEQNMFYFMMRSYGCINKEWLKSEGIKAKQCQHGVQYDMSKIFELNVLENRVDEEIDWGKEMKNRVEPSVVNIKPLQIYRQAINIFKDAKKEGARPMRMDWNDYWAQRSVLMPGGAIHSKYGEDQVIIKSMPRHLKNKKGFTSNMKSVEHGFFLNRPKEITAHTSTKYEWGKTRALYGCDITSHVHADFGLMNCEDTLPSYMPTGSKATPDRVKKAMNLMNAVPFCYDYDDFNSQHSTENMKAVIQAWIAVYINMLSDEQLASAMWTMHSIDNSFVKNGQIGNLYKTNGTLFSGWRLTSFMNTVLNCAYLKIVDIDRHCYKSIHNGDDVYASAKSIGDALELIEKTNKVSIRAQKNKMNIGTISEFLRMDIKSKDKTMSQYLTRGCATFVHSRIELDAPYSLRNLVSAYHSRYNELLERGATGRTANDCYRKQLFFASKLFDVNLELIDKLIDTHLVAGGINPKGKIGNYRIEEMILEESSVDNDEIKTLTAKGASSYTNFLKKKFGTIRESFSLEVVTRNIVSSYNLARKSCKIIPADSGAIMNEKAMRGAWSNAPGISTIHKMRMGISDIVMAIQYVNPGLANVLEKSKDPIKWMRILL